MIAGVGRGWVRLLNAVDRHEPWTLVVLGLLILYLLGAGAFLVHRWRRRDETGNGISYLRAQAGVLLAELLVAGLVGAILFRWLV